MHPFFSLLQHTLSQAPKSSLEGVIVFRQLDEDLTYRLQADGRGARLEAGDDPQAALRIFCDTVQLDDWLKGRWDRPLRCDGDRTLLDGLAVLLTPPQDPLQTRSGRSR